MWFGLEHETYFENHSHYQNIINYLKEDKLSVEENYALN